MASALGGLQIKHPQSYSLSWERILGIFSVCAPILVGAYYLHPQKHVRYFYKVIYYVMARAL